MSFCRVLISAELKTLSALHVGSGVEKDSPFSSKTEKEQSKEKESYSTLYLDFNKKPYLPASSLRGVLASAAPYFFTNENEDKVRQCFFGNSDSKEEGILRVFDATLESLPSFKDKVNTLEQGTILRTSISINPILGVAEEHHLFSLEIVPEGAVFKLEMSLESLNKEVTEENIKQFCGLLSACWNGKQFATVGAGRSKGFGLVKLENLKNLKVRCLTTDALAQWLRDDQPNDLNKFYKDWQHPITELDILKKQGYIVEITLVPKTKFLLNDPAFVIKKEEKEDDEPDLAFSRLSDGRAFIPAAALRGWVRGRVRKILLTIGKEKVENCLTSLFGDTKQRGVLFFSDLISEGNDVPEKQIFNAVDRFTGGVADGALYTVEAVQCKGLTGFVAIHHLSKHDSISNAEKGLLLLVARDLLEGELTLGWGNSRGYGSFSVTFKEKENTIGNIDELRALLSTKNDDVISWFKALDSLRCT